MSQSTNYQSHTVNLYKLKKNGKVSVEEMNSANLDYGSFVSAVEKSQKMHKNIISRVDRVRRDGNTKRAVPLKKFAEIKKAEKKMN